GLATSVALALLGLRLGHALDVSAEVLPPHDLLDRFQRITVGADRLKPALNIEKAPMAPLHPPMAHCGQRVRFAATWREELFEVPIRVFALDRTIAPGLDRPVDLLVQVRHRRGDTHVPPQCFCDVLNPTHRYPGQTYLHCRPSALVGQNELI